MIPNAESLLDLRKLTLLPFGCFSKDFQSAPILPILPAHPANIEKALSDIHAQSSARTGPGKHLQLLIIILPDVSGSNGKSQKQEFKFGRDVAFTKFFFRQEGLSACVKQSWESSPSVVSPNK